MVVGIICAFKVTCARLLIVHTPLFRVGKALYILLCSCIGLEEYQAFDRQQIASYLVARIPPFYSWSPLWHARACFCSNCSEKMTERGVPRESL